MHLIAAIVFFANLYLPGTDKPAYTGDIYAAQPIVAEHGIRIKTPELWRFSIDHTFMTEWVNTSNGRGPHVGVIDYKVSLNFRPTERITFNLSHGSTHNVDGNYGPIRRAHWAGVEWRIP